MLKGRRIVLTRPAGQAQVLAEQLAAQGAVVHLQPLLTITPITYPPELISAREQSWDWGFFVSPNAVHFAMRDLPHSPAWPAGWRVSTVGPSSEAALAGYGFTRIIAPQDAFDSEAVLRLPEMQPEAISGQTVLIFRAVMPVSYQFR